MHTDDLSKFLSALWPVIPEGHWVLFWGLPSKRSEWVQAFTDDTLLMLERWAEQENVYIGCATRGANLGPTLRGASRDCLAIPGVWLDVDYGTEHRKPNLPPTEQDARELVYSMGLPPTLIIHTGQGLHAWWLFREPFLIETDEDRARAAYLAQGWSDALCAHAKTRGWAADGVGDLARVMRPPGLWNRKGAPLRTKIISITDPCRYNPSDLDPLILAKPHKHEALSDNKWQFELAPGAEPPADKFALLLDIDLQFKLSWLHGRRDLQDQSESSYDLSLATRAFAAGWTAQEVVNLLIAHRRKHKADLKLRKDYYERTLTKAISGKDKEARRQLIDDLKAGKPIPEAVIEDPAENLAILSGLLGVEISKFIKYRGEENTYQLELNGRMVNIKGVEELESKARFRKMILDHTAHLIPDFTREQWKDRLAQLFKAVQEVVVDAATNKAVYESWIEMYLHDTGVEIEEHWEKAAVEYRPFRIGNDTYIVAEGFRRFLLVQINERVSSQVMTVELTKLGYQYQRSNVRNSRGKKTKRSVWKVQA
jgi:hypothetical protein